MNSICSQSVLLFICFSLIDIRNENLIFLMEMSGNRNHTMLLNGFLASIECEELPMPLILNVSIKSISTRKMRGYFRISVYLWAEGLLDISRAESRKVRKDDDAVHIFEMLGCHKSAGIL